MKLLQDSINGGSEKDEEEEEDGLGIWFWALMAFEFSCLFGVSDLFL